MYSPELNHFIKDCFLTNDPICEIQNKESDELDPFTNALIQEMIESKN